MLVVFHFRTNAKKQLFRQRNYVQKDSRVLALANYQLIEDWEGGNNIDDGFWDSFKQANTELTRLEKNFWANLRFIDLTALCAISSVAGLIGGYCSVWLISVIGTIGTIKLIRLTYKIIWYIKPEFDGGKQQIQNGNNVLIKRDTNRTLPGILIISVMGLIGVAILLVAVYYWTG